MPKARASVIVVVALAALVVAAVRVHAGTRPSAQACGGNLWHLKTLSDAQRRIVNLTPRSTTIGAIAARTAPTTTPTTRRTPFQRQTWQVVAEIVNYRIEDGELRMILFDDGTYMNAAVPTPGCLPQSARARTSITGTWHLFTHDCAHPVAEWQPLGAVAYVSGVGFWSQRRTVHGTAQNGAELHPVTGLRIVTGCG